MANSNTRTVTLTNNNKQIDVALSDVRLMPTGVVIVANQQQRAGFDVLFNSDIQSIQFN